MLNVVDLSCMWHFIVCSVDHECTWGSPLSVSEISHSGSLHVTCWYVCACFCAGLVSLRTDRSLRVTSAVLSSSRESSVSLRDWQLADATTDTIYGYRSLPLNFEPRPVVCARHDMRCTLLWTDLGTKAIPCDGRNINTALRAAMSGTLHDYVVYMQALHSILPVDLTF